MLNVRIPSLLGSKNYLEIKKYVERYNKFWVLAVQKKNSHSIFSQLPFTCFVGEWISNQVRGFFLIFLNHSLPLQIAQPIVVGCRTRILCNLTQGTLQPYLNSRLPEPSNYVNRQLEHYPCKPTYLHISFIV